VGCVRGAPNRTVSDERRPGPVIDGAGQNRGQPPTGPVLDNHGGTLLISAAWRLLAWLASAPLVWGRQGGALVGDRRLTRGLGKGAIVAVDHPSQVRALARVLAGHGSRTPVRLPKDLRTLLGGRAACGEGSGSGLHARCPDVDGDDGEGGDQEQCGGHERVSRTGGERVLYLLPGRGAGEVAGVLAG